MFLNQVIFELQLEDIYKKAHAAIRAEPEHKAPPKKEVVKKRFVDKLAFLGCLFLALDRIKFLLRLEF